MTRADSKKRREMICRLFNDGYEKADIQVKLQVSRNMVDDALLRAGISKPTTHATVRERRLRIVARLQEGKTISDVCVEFGVSATTVRGIITEFGITTISKRVNPSSYKIIAELLNTTDTQIEIANRLGVTKQYISRVYRLAVEVGIKFPNRVDSKDD